MKRKEIVLIIIVNTHYNLIVHPFNSSLKLKQDCCFFFFYNTNKRRRRKVIWTCSRDPSWKLNVKKKKMRKKSMPLSFLAAAAAAAAGWVLLSHCNHTAVWHLRCFSRPKLSADVTDASDQKSTLSLFVRRSLFSPRLVCTARLKLRTNFDFALFYKSHDQRG